VKGRVIIGCCLVVAVAVAAAVGAHPRSAPVVIVGGLCILGGFVALARTPFALLMLGAGCVSGAMGAGTPIAGVVAGWILLLGVWARWNTESGSHGSGDLVIAVVAALASLVVLAGAFFLGVVLRPGPEVVAGEVVLIAVALGVALSSSQHKERSGGFLAAVTAKARGRRGAVKP